MVSIDNTITKVLMTADTVGGVWTYCLELIEELRFRNIHFHLVTAGRPLSSDQRRQIERLDNVTLHETEYKLEWMDNPWDDIDFSGWQLIELERTIKPDIIHLNSYSYASLPFKAPVLVVAHSDVFSWWFCVKKTIPGHEWQEYFRRVRGGIRNADRLIAPSEAMLGMLTAIYGPASNSQVIYNGRNPAGFRIEEKGSHLMCAGRFWDEAKNLELLSRSAENIDAEIFVAGDVYASQRYRVPENIRFLGRLGVEEMATKLSTALIFVAPARYEPFGLSILEAAISGCALVLGNIASLREIWQDNAIYVDVDDAEALSSVCNRLLRDRKLALQYGEKAKKRAAAFSLQNMGRGYADMYREAVRKKQDLKRMQTA